MQHLITEQAKLTFIQLDRFNPDYDDEACFTIHSSQFEIAANMTFDENGNRTYRMPAELNQEQRILTMQAIDFLIDACFAEKFLFEDDENSKRIYFTEDRLCSDKGRSLN